MNRLLRRTAAFAAMSVMALSGLRAADVVANYEVIPLPQRIMPGRGLPFTVNTKTVIVVPKGDAKLLSDARFLASYINDACGITPKIVNKAPKSNAIILSATLGGDNAEAYAIEVNSDLITVNGASAAGTFYGIQTLRKSIAAPESADNTLVFPSVSISDAPRFSYRGAHFDVSRHFFPADSVKRFIDMLALHNINRLHWHLTDDQGWRLESKKYPGLTEIGSKRGGTVIGHNSGKYDGKPYGGYYTQEEARDIVNYATERNIIVIPEIDLPGHMLGALAAYPDLGCTGGPYEVWQQWGVADDVLCAGNPDTYKFIDGVLEEVMDIFPSEYIHLGGDECPKVRWKECPKCQAKINELGLKSDDHSSAEEKLQNHVMKHATETLAKHGRKMIGWDEIIEGGLFPGATVMAWRGADAAAESALQGHDAILTPTANCYFDYYQTRDTKDEPIAIGGYLPIEKVYSLEPVSPKLNAEQAKHIIGAQANLWTEYIPTYSQVEYMELPRLAAICEVQWTQPSQKDYEYFTKRLPQLIAQYDNEGYNYSRRIYDIDGKVNVNADTRKLILTLTTVDNAPLYLTLDGTAPSASSIPYTGPVAIDKSSRIRAVAVRDGKPGREWNDSVTVAKSTASPITLTKAPHPNYTGNGASTLNDGRQGNNASIFGSGEWLGFVGNDLEAVIDLGAPVEVSNVSFNTLINTGSWIIDADSAEVALSNDGTDFTTVAAESFTQPDGEVTKLATHKLTFDPQAARYVKVRISPLNALPEWHGGRGKPAFVFVDEIIVN